MSLPKAILSSKGERWLRSGHPWVFRDDVLGLEGAVNGDVVSLYSQGKRFLGQAFFSSHSRITLRLISYQDQCIDQAYWRYRLQKAVESRQAWIDREQACRLVFSEADGLPGLISDWYAGNLVVQTLIPGTDRILIDLCGILQELLDPISILIRNDPEARSLEHLSKETWIFYGKPAEIVWVREGAVRYGVDLLKGQKTGAYLDQRENRLHQVSYPQGQGRVLDCFTYAGGFALHLAGQAQEVTAIDDSAPALEWGQRNAQENGFSNINFLKANVFDFLKKAEDQGQRFDLIVLDPPPFARKKSAIAGALRGYRELNLRALRCLNAGGILSTFSCSYNMSEGLFGEMLSQAVQGLGKSVFLLEKRLQARDHPIVLNFPESHYLKGMILLVN
jgi:23S rRNA (cytosine1962-C5)-methyltransferase